MGVCTFRTSSLFRVLPVPCAVFLGAGGALGLARDCRLGASTANAKLFGPLSFVALALEGVLFMLGPLTSGLFVFAAFLLALLKFDWAWSTARLLTLGSFLALGFGFRLLGCLAGSVMVHWKLILLEYVSGPTRRHRLSTLYGQQFR